MRKCLIATARTAALVVCVAGSCGPAQAAAAVQTVAASSSNAQALPAPVSLAFRQAGIPETAIATYVQEIDRGQVVMAVNAGVPVSPASTMKLVTSAAALDLLGPAYTWKTRAYAAAPLEGDLLRGDLVIKGGGDPKLVLENFWLFLRRLRAQGIREIAGNLVLDRSFFASDEAQPHDAGMFDADPFRTYNVGPDALLLNYKALNLHLTPNAGTGRADLRIDPPLANVILAAPELASGECGDWRAGLLLTVTPARVGFNGKLPASCGERDWNIHPSGMSRNDYFGAVFRALWQDLGGVLRGTVVDGVVPAQARLVAEQESATLPEVMRDMNKYSNNVMARQLLLTIAAEKQPQPATPERGAHVVKTWLASRGIENPEVVIDNGSGLSRAERVSAATLGRLLVAAFRAPTMPEFVSSLPLAGVDGTMQRRLQDWPVAGHAHIKTGSLNDVRAIAGYVQAASGRQYAVVCIINHRNAPRGQEAQDLLLQWVYEHG